MDYRETLNLPRTEFPMRANLARREPEILRRWAEMRLYEKLLEKNAGGRRFVLHDGPPVRQWPHPHRPHAQQRAEARHREASRDARVLRALRTRVGLPRPADR